MRENRSVSRILAILELISQHPEGLTLGEIYRALDIPKATAHDFLKTLYSADAIYYKDERIKNYVIGSKLFAIGSVYTKNSNLIDAAQLELKQYADKHERTVFIVKRIENKMVYVHKYQSENSKILTPEQIGSTIYNFTDNPIGIGFSAFDKAVKNMDKPEYEHIRSEGYVLAKNSVDSHICVLSVPVYNFENRVVGIIAAADLSVDECKLGESHDDFIRIAKNISRKLGYLGE